LKKEELPDESTENIFINDNRSFSKKGNVTSGSLKLYLYNEETADSLQLGTFYNKNEYYKFPVLEDGDYPTLRMSHKEDKVDNIEELVIQSFLHSPLVHKARDFMFMGTPSFGYLNLIVYNNGMYTLGKRFRREEGKFFVSPELEETLKGSIKESKNSLEYQIEKLKKQINYLEEFEGRIRITEE
jgi:hypothetical protein